MRGSLVSVSTRTAACLHTIQMISNSRVCNTMIEYLEIFHKNMNNARADLKNGQ